MSRRLILAALAACCLCADLHAQAIAVSLAGRAMPSPLTIDILRWADEVARQVTLVACPVDRGTTYYVSATGSDAAAGTSEGAAWQTISKVNTTFAAWGGSSGGLAIKLKCGDSWVGTTGVNMPTDNCTLASYGTGAAPIVSAFATTWPIDGTDHFTVPGGATNRYVATVNPVGWVRETAKPLKGLRRVASTAEVESTPNSFFHDGATTLSINLRNDAGTTIDPDTVAVDATLAATTPDSGVYVTGNNCRVHNIDAPGWGCNGSGTINQEYSVKFGITGSQVGAATSCAAYYGSGHNLGHNPGAGSSGGFVYFGDCTFGYCVLQGCTGFISYAGLGLQESLVHNCVCTHGALLTDATRTKAVGQAGYMHTGGLSTPPALGLWIDCRTEAPANGAGASSGWTFDHFAYTANPAACKAITLGQVMARGLGVGDLHPFAKDGTLDLCGDYDLRPTDSLGDALGWSYNPRGFVYNYNIDVDLNHAGMTESYFALYNATGTRSPKFRGGRFHVRTKPSTHFGLDLVLNYDGTGDAGVVAANGVLAAGSELSGSIFTVDRTGTAVASPIVRPALPNSATYLLRNAYYGLTGDGAVVGVSNTVGGVTLGSMPAVGGVPSVASPLTGAGQAGLCEYDLLRRSRHPTTPAIGPLESPEAALVAPTAAELYGLMAGRFDYVDAVLSDVEATVNATSTTAGAINTKLGTPAGASVSADLAAVEAQTDDIGVAGAGLTAITPSVVEPRQNLPPDPGFIRQISKRVFERFQAVGEFADDLICRHPSHNVAPSGDSGRRIRRRPDLPTLEQLAKRRIDLDVGEFADDLICRHLDKHCGPRAALGRRIRRRPDLPTLGVGHAVVSIATSANSPTT